MGAVRGRLRGPPGWSPRAFDVGGAVLDASMVVPDGRALAYSECGAPGGVPIMYCHGGPGSRLDLVWFDRTFADLGVRVIAADRPGYGGSTP